MRLMPPMTTRGHGQCDQKACNNGSQRDGNGTFSLADGKDHMLQIRVKEVLRGGSNAVDLSDGPDAQQPCRGAQEGKGFGQPFPAFPIPRSI